MNRYKIHGFGGSSVTIIFLMNSWSIVPNFSTFQDTFPMFCSVPTSSFSFFFTGHKGSSNLPSYPNQGEEGLSASGHMYML